MYNLSIKQPLPNSTRRYLCNRGSLHCIETFIIHKFTYPKTVIVISPTKIDANKY